MSCQSRCMDTKNGHEVQVRSVQQPQHAGQEREGEDWECGQGQRREGRSHLPADDRGIAKLRSGNGSQQQDGERPSPRFTRLRPWRFRDPRETSTQSLLPTDELTYIRSHSRSSRLSSDTEASSIWYSSDFLSPLTPTISERDQLLTMPRRERQRLLMIYIHGYMGDTTSFRSFPAHVHGYLARRLKRTHDVHTKIYPRYKTYCPLPVSAAEFGEWLLPHVDEQTEIVLVGHSLGGMIAADAVLHPPKNDNGIEHPFRHRIIGTISVDSPFLGLNPRIILAGLKSLFVSEQDSTDTLTPVPTNTSSILPTESTSRASVYTCNPDTNLPTSHETRGHSHSRLHSESLDSMLIAPSPPYYICDSNDSTPHDNNHTNNDPNNESNINNTPSPLDHPLRQPTAAALSDPNFNPPYHNDPYNPVRSLWGSLWHFSKQHKHRPHSLASASLVNAARHLEYVWCLLDRRQMTRRYVKIGELDRVRNGGDMNGGVRWVNYYTVCSGKTGGHKAQEGMREEKGIRGELVRFVDSLRGRKKNNRSVEEKSGKGKAKKGLDWSGEVEVVKQSSLPYESIPNLCPNQNGDGVVESVYSVLGWYESSEGSDSSSCHDLDRGSSDGGHEGVGMTRDVGAQTDAPSQVPEVPSAKVTATAQDSVDMGATGSGKDTDGGGVEDGWSLTEEERIFKRELDRRLRDEVETVNMVGSTSSIGSASTAVYAQATADGATTVDNSYFSGKMGVGEEEVNVKGNHRPFCVVPSSVARRDRAVRNHPGKSIPGEPVSKPTQRQPQPHQERTTEKDKKTRHEEKQARDEEDSGRWVKVDMGDVDEVGAHTGLFRDDGGHYHGFLGDVCLRVVGWVEEQQAKGGA